MSGYSMQLWPSAPAAGQDQKYFPLGTSTAKPAGASKESGNVAI